MPRHLPAFASLCHIREAVLDLALVGVSRQTSVNFVVMVIGVWCGCLMLSVVSRVFWGGAGGWTISMTLVCSVIGQPHCSAHTLSAMHSKSLMPQMNSVRCA